MTPRAGRYERRGGPDRVALVATVLLAAATVATAWSGYQASRWGSEATKATMRGNTARLEATQQRPNLANAQAGVDVAVFTQWADAYANGQGAATRLLFPALPRGVQARGRRLAR